MRIASTIACLVMVATAGCRQQPSVKMADAPMDEVVRQQAAAVRMQPGEWEVALETLDMTMTGAPAGMPPIPHQAKVTTRTCLTPEQVDKPSAMMGGGLMQQFKDSCVYDRFEMKGGRIAAAMHCDMPGGQKVRATTHGTFTATDISSESESIVSGMPNGMGMSTKVKMVGRHLGACEQAAGQPRG